MRCQAYIHKARVHVFNEAATESKVEVDPETIKDVPGAVSVRAADLLRTHRHLHVDSFAVVLQATWVEMDDHHQLIVCGTAGVQAYEQVASNAGKLNPVWSDNICERMEASAGMCPTASAPVLGRPHLCPSTVQVSPSTAVVPRPSAKTASLLAPSRVRSRSTPLARSSRPCCQATGHRLPASTRRSVAG